MESGIRSNLHWISLLGIVNRFWRLLALVHPPLILNLQEQTNYPSVAWLLDCLLLQSERWFYWLANCIFFYLYPYNFDVHNPTKPVLAFSIEHIIKRSFSKVNDQMTPNSKGVLLHPHDCMQTTQNVDGSQWSGKMNVSIVFLVAIYTLTRLSQFQDRKLPAFTTTSPKTRSTANAPNWHTSNDNQLVLATSWSDLKYSLLKVYQPSEISPVYANNCSSNV